MDKIKLKSRDGWFLSITPGLARKSKIISDMLEARKHNLNSIHEIFPIPYRGRTLEKVLEWCNFHQDDPIMEMEERDRYLCRTGLPPWDVEFYNKVDFTMANEIIKIAHQLKMEQLIHHSQRIIVDILIRSTKEESDLIVAIMFENLYGNASAA